MKPELNELKLLVFDWDGTLMDSVDRIVASMQAASRDTDIKVPTVDEIKEIIGLGLKEALHTLFPHHDVSTHEKLTEHYRQHFVYESTVESRPFEGTRETLVNLVDSGYVLAVATGKARKGLDRALEETALGDLFDITRCADETRSKPHPQMLHEIMDQLGVPASQTLMIGDTEYDLAMANAANALSMGVSYGVHDKERLLTHDPVACLDDIRDIRDWLPQHRIR